MQTVFKGVCRRSHAFLQQGANFSGGGENKRRHSVV
jgi:hypothetical protein